MGEIVFVDLPETGSKINAEDQIAEVESVKSVAEVYSPVSGSVIKVNEELFDNPGAINKDAYGSFLAIVEMSDPIELDNLLSAPEYAKYCKELREEEKH
jgi:glycine cleavage system H protein